MHFPRMSRELLIFPASFSLSPNVFVLLHLSEPARSHRENLRIINNLQVIPCTVCVCVCVYKVVRLHPMETETSFLNA